MNSREKGLIGITLGVATAVGGAYLGYKNRDKIKKGYNLAKEKAIDGVEITKVVTQENIETAKEKVRPVIIDTKAKAKKATAKLNPKKDTVPVKDSSEPKYEPVVVEVTEEDYAFNPVIDVADLEIIEKELS